MVFPSDPQISPDGRQVAFVLTRIEEEDPTKPDEQHPKPRDTSAIHVSDGRRTRQLTSGVKRDESPRWSPDGQHLVFTSSRHGPPQLFEIPLDGGEARQLTHFKTGVRAPKWSPDGRLIAYLSSGDDEDKRDERGEARVIENLQYKFNGAGFLPDQPSRLYLHDLETGHDRVLHTPVTAISDYEWTPDGTALLMITAIDATRAGMWQNEVFEVNLDGAVRQVTNWASSLSGLAVHPSGERFVAIGFPSSKRNTEDAHVFEFDRFGSAEQNTGRRLDEHVDYPAGNLVAGDCHVGFFPTRPVWVNDTLTVPYTVGGSSGAFDLVGGQQVSRAFHEGTVIPAFTMNENGMAFIRESDHEFPEVYLGGERVTNLAAHLGDFPRRKAQRVTVPRDGGEVEGWVLRPETTGGPALLSIHGGPHTAYGHGFMHEFQLFAERGYTVCYSNPRGSVGYGQTWSDTIYGRWGTVDYADLTDFFDACLERHPDLDRERTAVMGGSYGGYMTNWIVGHTDRFRCAVTDRSICNLVSFNGTSDIAPRFWRDELGLEFINPGDIAGLWEMSPLKYVNAVRTPTLIIHSEEDHRCPVEQAEQWFTALKLLGVETRFVRYPGENHELSRSGRPDRRMHRLHEYLSWLDGHLQG